MAHGKHNFDLGERGSAPNEWCVMKVFFPVVHSAIAEDGQSFIHLLDAFLQHSLVCKGMKV